LGSPVNGRGGMNSGRDMHRRQRLDPPGRQMLHPSARDGHFVGG
jgi:hypothetical protein